MPRSSTSSRSSSTYRPPAKIPVAPPYAVAPFRPTNPPTTGQMLKEGITSGIGSGIGFGIGTSISRALFGSTAAPMVSAAPPAIPAIPTPPVNVSDFQQCQHNAFDASEKMLCMYLYMPYTEFKQCMKTSDNQIHMCKEFLPKN